MKVTLIIIGLVAGFLIGEFALRLILYRNPTPTISAEQAYQIGYEHGINAGIAGVWLRTNKEVYYINEIKWRANRFHNDITSLGRDGKTNGVDFWRPVPVNTNYLEYRKEEWPTNEL